MNCYSGVAETIKNVSEQPFQWTTSQVNCGEGLGCQEMVLITQNGETGPAPDLQPLPWRDVPITPPSSPTCILCTNSEDRSPKYQERRPP